MKITVSAELNKLNFSMRPADTSRYLPATVIDFNALK